MIQTFKCHFRLSVSPGSLSRSELHNPDNRRLPAGSARFEVQGLRVTRSKEQAGHCQPPGAHCIAPSLVRCVGGEGESKGGDEEICGGVLPPVQAAEWWTLIGSPTLL